MRSNTQPSSISRGGGTGFSFSNLRPSETSWGPQKAFIRPVSFMTVFDTATEAVKQGGTRRGANMGILRVDHPDILGFITAKDDNARFNNFTSRSRSPDRFMQAVKDDTDYELINPRTKNVVRSLRAREVFDLIVNHAWKNGEPGIVFLDRSCVEPDAEDRRDRVDEPLRRTAAAPLRVLQPRLDQPFEVRDRRSVDYPRLKKTVWKAVHFLDNVIDVNRYPIQKIAEMTRAEQEDRPRRYGLG